MFWNIICLKFSMEQFTLDKDINVFYIMAKSFPDGIKEAHETLHSLVPFAVGRRFFGISRPEKGVITYKAAAEEMYDGEAEKLNLQTFIIKSGEYTFEKIFDFHKNLNSFDETFKKLLTHPDIDAKGYCVEWYLNDKDVICMVRLENKY